MSDEYAQKLIKENEAIEKRIAELEEENQKLTKQLQELEEKNKKSDTDTATGA
jgi:chaperonin cofactor prefoldin